MRKQYTRPETALVKIHAMNALTAASDSTIRKNDEKTVSTGDAKSNIWTNNWDSEE